MTTDRAVTEQLRRLRRLGFRADPLLNQDGEVDAVYLSREHRDLRDAVVIDSTSRAHAYRMHSRWDPEHPFHVDADAIEWRRRGGLVVVTNSLLALPWNDTDDPPVSKPDDSDGTPAM
jgi:hypothetical protein